MFRNEVKTMIADVVSKAKKERGSLLRAEVKKLGLPLPFFNKYAPGIDGGWHGDLEVMDSNVSNACWNDLDSCFVDGGDVVTLVNEYLQGGFPTLDWTVGVLAPAIRQRVLWENETFVEKDPHCLAFISGSEKYPDVNAVRDGITRDREGREHQLEKELERQGIFACCISESTEGERGGYQDHAIRSLRVSTRIKDGARNIVNKYLISNSDNVKDYARAFINEGSYQPDTIAYAAAVDLRRKSLLAECPPSATEPLKSLDSSFFWPQRHTVSSIEEYRNHIMDMNGELVGPFLCGETEACCASDIITKIRADQTSRRDFVEQLATEYGIDMIKFRQSSENWSLSFDLNEFVEEGEGEGTEIMANIALEEGLQKNSLPKREIFVSRNPALKHRFELVSKGSCSDVLDFVNELCESQERRYNEAIRSYLLARQAEYKNEDQTLSAREQNHLQQSHFVKFGIESAEATSKSCQEMEREERLKSRMRQANPPLPLTRLSTDSFLMDFIKGNSNFSNEHQVVEKIQQEVTERRTDIKSLLNKQLSNPVTDAELKKDESIRRYISRGTGITTKLVKDFVEEKRKKELIHALDGSGLSPISQLIGLHQCQAFIKGTSSVHVNDLLPDLVASFQTRKDEIKKAFEANGTSEESMRWNDNYGLMQAVDGHLDAVDSDITFLRGAICFYSKLNVTRVDFGSLKDLLPCPSYDTVIDWGRELSQNVLSWCKKIVDKNLSMIDMNLIARPLTQDDANTPMDLSNCIATKIHAFYHVDFHESIFFGLSKYSSEHDHRLVLLLTRPNDSPWSTVKEAAEEIGRERKSRRRAFDASFPPELYSTLSFGYRESDPRKKYLDDKLGLEEALDLTGRNYRSSMLEAALFSADLLTELSVSNEECVDFLSNGGITDDIEVKISNLISKLHHERVQRGGLMLEYLKNLAPDLPYSAFVKAGILGEKNSHCGKNCTNKPIEPFPGKEDVSYVRDRYVELGQGKPEDVVQAFIMFQRKEKLDFALDSTLAKSHLYDYDTMRKSKRCKAFVANTEAGLPSDEEVERFRVIFEKKLQSTKEKHKDAINDDNVGDAGSNDDRSSYKCHDYYDDYDGPPSVGYMDDYPYQFSDLDLSDSEHGWYD